MANQSGTIKLEGKIGDLSFYKSKDSYKARTKGGATASQIKNDKAFEQTRENNQEFALAAHISKRIRLIFKSILLQVPVTKINTGLNSRILRIIKADPESERGKRTIVSDNFRLLLNFQFNPNVHLSDTFLEKIDNTSDTQAKVIYVNIPAFNPRISIVFPDQATSFRIVTAIGILDVTNDNDVKEMLSYSDFFDCDQNLDKLDLSFQIPQTSAGEAILLFGIVFYKQVIDCLVPLDDGKRNALAVINTYSL